jgi:guanylate kinase
MSNERPREGQLFVVAAPSGAGKTSLVNALVERDPSLVISVSYTTRPRRPGEEDGKHYHFTEPATFETLLADDAFLEHALVFGHRYGTHGATTRRLLRDGRDVILEIDWQGARQVRESFPGCRTIFILPPSLRALRQRLGSRAQDSEAVIDERMRKARAEISHCGEFDYIVVNDDFEQALAELQALVDCCREGRACPQTDHGPLLAELMGNG